MDKLGIFEIEGHAEIQNRMWKYINGGRTHSTLLFSGKGEEIKPTLALGLAKFFLCKERPKERPFCGACTSCRRIDRNLHPDVLWNKDQDPTENIKIETVRQWCHAMELSAMEGGAKLCLIEHAHLMTTSSANALLKSLEEPGADRYFILMTPKEGMLLPTIMSRCLDFHFAGEIALPLSDEEFEKPLVNYVQTFDPNQLKPVVDSKDHCLQFVGYLQKKIRSKVIEGKITPWLAKLDEDRALIAFDELMQIENRLRSNANHGLMVENFLRQHIA